MNGYQVKHANMNITDVGHLQADGDVGEDKMEASAREKGRSGFELAELLHRCVSGGSGATNIREPDVVAEG